MKILYTATSDVHIRTFHIPHLQMLKGLGFEVHLAVEKRGQVDLSFVDKVVYLPFKRKIFNFNNYSAYIDIKNLISKENYDIIHCHTPIVAAITRLAARKNRKKGTKVIYTAHGFHFYKNAPIINWLVFYTIEKLLSKITDVIVTINQEDFTTSINKLNARFAYKIPGMGVNLSKFHPVSIEEKRAIRKKLSLNENDFLVIVVGELNANKNQSFVIEAISEVKNEIKNIKVLMIGKGNTSEKLKKLIVAKLLEDKIALCGWQDNVSEFSKAADVGISASIREGFGIALVEQMACGLPVLASNNRGHKEIVENGANGFLFELNNPKNLSKLLIYLDKNQDVLLDLGQNAVLRASSYTYQHSVAAVKNIYQNLLYN